MIEKSEHSQAIHIADRWLDFKMNALVQMVPGDPDCDACILARQFIRTEDSLRTFMTSNAELTSESNELHRKNKILVEALERIGDPDNWGVDGGWCANSYPDEIALAALDTAAAMTKAEPT